MKEKKLTIIGKDITQKQLEKLLTDVEKLKDKVRQNGSYNE